MKFAQLILATVMLTGVVTSAQAQILIGQTVGVTGAVAATVRESNAGAMLYLDSVNSKGGIGGEKIVLITLDDKFDTALAAANTRKLIEDRHVVAMFMSRGTPHTEGMIPILDQYGVALIGPSTGAMVLHSPVRKHVFNVRATYQREAEKAIAHLASTGISRIAIIHVDDSFGADGLEGAQKGLLAAKLAAVAIAKFDRSKPDFSAIGLVMIKAQAQAIMVIGSGTAVVDGIKAVKAAGSTAQFVTLSNNASAGFVKLLGDQARGIIVTQVLPQTFGYAIVRQATQLAKARDINDLSPAMLEGFASAKVLVEALRHSAPRITREKIQSALEGMRQFDIGGLEISYSPTDHTGLDFADLSIISADGKFMR